MSSFTFTHVRLKLLSGDFNPEAANFYARLVTSPPSAGMVTASQLAEAAGGTYVTKPLSNKAITADGTGAIIDFDDPTWDALTAAGSITGMVVCQQIGSVAAATDPLICYNELGSAYTPNGATFSIVLPSSGVLKLA